MFRNDLTKEQLVDVHKLRDENVEKFDIWLLDYMDIIKDTSKMRYKDFICEYYIEKCREDKINSLLGE